MLDVIREFRVGRPQIFAGLMLLAFFAQAVWVSASRKLSPLEHEYVASGYTPRAGQEYRITSPLTAWVAALPFKMSRKLAGHLLSEQWVVPPTWLARLPFIIFGVWLGAALWWVARRLFDDAGGYMALGLYCSSPAMVMISGDIGPEILLAWSIFGLIYTAIGVAHTLYAPPKKWLPRILILGLSIGFSLAATLWSVTVVLLAFAFMVYLAPGRRKAALLVLLSACAIGVSVYIFFVGITGARWLGVRSLITPDPSFDLLRNLKFMFADGYSDLNSYLFVLLFIVALTVYGSWARARYFGNTTPLVTSFAVVLLFALVPGIHMWTATLGLPFVFTFVGGIAADLLETGSKTLVAAVLAAGFAVRGILSVLALSGWIHNP
jgi:hypothetical protein